MVLVRLMAICSDELDVPEVFMVTGHSRHGSQQFQLQIFLGVPPKGKMQKYW